MILTITVAIIISTVFIVFNKIHYNNQRSVTRIEGQPKQYLSQREYDLAMNNTEVIDGYTTEISTVYTKNDTNFERYIESDTEIYKITAPSASRPYYRLKIKGVDSHKIYVIKAEIKTENIVKNSYSAGRGANLVVNYSKNGWSWAYSIQNLSGTKDWTSVNIVAKPEYSYLSETEEDAEIELRLGIGGVYEDEDSKGIAYFRNIQIIDAEDETQALKLSDSEKVKIVESSPNKKIKFVCNQQAYNNSSITEEEFIRQINLLETVYDGYAEHVGHSARTDQLLYPYKGDQLVIIENNELYYGYGALANNPISTSSTWQRDFVEKSDNSIGWGLLHEMGHVFDNPLSSADGKVDNKKSAQWDFNAEMFANMKVFYVLDRKNIRVAQNGSLTGWTYEQQLNDWEKAYNTTFVRKTEFQHDGLQYFIYKLLTKDDGYVDWEAFENTYKWYNDTDMIINGNAKRLIRYIYELDEHSDMDIRSKISDNNIQVINSEYNPVLIKSIEANYEGLDLNVNCEYKNLFKISNQGYDDILTYKSDNPGVATIDENGTITTYSAGEVTFTAESYWDKSKTLSITKNVGNIEITNVESNIGEVYEGMMQKITVSTNSILTSENNSLKDRIDIKVKKDNQDVTSDFIIQMKSGNSITIELITPDNIEAGNYTIELNMDGQKTDEEIIEVKEIVYTQISSAEELKNLNNNPGFYRLEQDIDLKNEKFTPINNFYGIIDGNGHTIIGLKIEGNGNDRGLLGTVSSSIVIKNLNIERSTISGNDGTAAFIGGARQGALIKIENVSSDAKIIGGYRGTAGIIGAIADARVKIDKAFNTGDINGRADIGGIIGVIFRSYIDITNTFNTGKIESSSNTNIGGIVGGDRDIAVNITNAYNLYRIVKNGDDGLPLPLMGEIIGGYGGYGGTQVREGCLKNVYYLENGPITGGQYDEDSDIAIVEGDYSYIDTYEKSREELKEQSTYENFDFENVWEIRNETYPTLKDNEYNFIKDIVVGKEEINIPINKNISIEKLMAKYNMEIQPENANKQNLKYTFDSEYIQLNDNFICGVKEGQTKFTIQTDDCTCISKELTININSPVAEIGEVEYLDIDTAIQEVQDGETIEILKDIEKEIIDIKAKPEQIENRFEIDLGNNNITATSINLSGVSVCLKNGTINGKINISEYTGIDNPHIDLENILINNPTEKGIVISDKCLVNVCDGTTIKSNIGIENTGNNNGISTVIIDGGTIETVNTGIYNKDSCVSIIKRGTVKSTDGIGIEGGIINIGDNSEEYTKDDPKVEGKTYGIKIDENAQGINFYNGSISGQTAIGPNKVWGEIRQEYREIIQTENDIEIIFLQIIKYTLTIDANGGILEGSSSIEQPFQTTCIIEEPIPPEGYEIIFDSNALDVEAPERVISTKRFTEWTEEGNGNWDSLTKTYTFGKGDGKLTANYDDNEINLPSINRAGYKFLGWFTQAHEGNSVGGIGEKYKPSSEITLYAHWEPVGVEYKIYTYKMDTFGQYGSPEEEIRTGKTEESINIEPLAMQGFEYDEEAENKISDIIAGDGSTILKVYYKRNKYEVNLIKGKGIAEVIGNGSFYYDKEITISSTVKEGYEWSKWTGTQEIIERESTITVPINGLTLTATAGPIQYTIEYDLQNGEMPEGIVNPQEYTVESELITLNNPERTGYTFIGWTTEEVNVPQLKVTIDKGSVGNKKYIANWKANEYTVTFDVKGGNPLEKDTKLVIYGEKYNQLPIPTREGYEFMGWYTENEEIITSETIVEILSDITLNAKWKERSDTKYTVNIYKMDTFGQYIKTTENKYGTTGKIVNADITPEKGFTYNEEKSLSSSVLAGDGSTVLNVYFDRNKYTLNITAGNGILSVSEGGKYYYEEKIEISTSVKPGYKWNKWIGTQTIDNQNSTITMPAENVSVEATATIVGYNITYDLEGGYISNDYPKTYNVENETFILPIPEKEGYTFIGWTGSNGQVPNTQVIIYKGSVGDIFYKANWKVETYTVTLDANGGKVNKKSKDTIIVSYGENYELPIPEKEECIFMGWYTEGNKKIVSGESVISSNVNLIAHWEDKANGVRVNKIEIIADKEEIDLLSNIKTLQLTADVKPENATNKTVIWESMNKDIATVNSNGLVTATGEKEGIVTITAKPEDGSEVLQTKNIDVVNVIKIESIKLEEEKITIKEGEEKILKLIINPEEAYKKPDDFVWKSDKADVASVDNTGTLKAIKEGRATITVSTKDGKHRTNCLVEVIKNTDIGSEESENKGENRNENDGNTGNKVQKDDLTTYKGKIPNAGLNRGIFIIIIIALFNGIIILIRYRKIDN